MSQITTIHLPYMQGRKVKWNQDEIAEVVEAWAVIHPVKAGETVVGHACESWALFSIKGRGLVTDRLNKQIVECQDSLEAKEKQ